MIRITLALSSALCFSFPQLLLAKELNFSELFAGAVLGNEVVIQIASDDILVFDGDGPFFLEGKDFFLYAPNVVVRANTVVQSFSAGNLPATPPGTPATPAQAGIDQTGATGLPGALGNSGVASGLFLLDIDAVSGDEGKTVVFRAVGQTGGRGQKGGQGGQGGEGHPGANAASDFPACSKPCPDSGGPGAPGGKRGAGGQGGDGGLGGTVYISGVLNDELSRSSAIVRIDVSGGAGGQPGERGEQGAGGGGGPRGSGGNCICRSPPPPGPNGPVGADDADPTPPSNSGGAGSIKPTL